MTEIVTDKVFASPSPVDPQHVLFKTQPLAPNVLIQRCKELRITAIVRLNDAYYQRSEFINSMIHHYDLQFPDGSVPSDEQVIKFLKIMEQESKVLVHCMAGLGRTGTLIALYLIWKLKFTAREAIAWLRLMRPGSICG